MLPLILIACDARAPDPAEDTALVTWTDDLAPVVAQRCAGCHASTLAPFPLSTWEEVEPMASWIVSVVEEGLMPPWSFQDETCRSVPDSLALTEDERALFLAWRDGGYARGAGEGSLSLPAAASPPRPADLRVAPDEAFEVSPEETDPYWCAYLSDKVAEELWVEGAEIALDTVEISHHAFLYAVPEAAQPVLDAQDAADPAPGFRCEGGLAMADGVTMLAGWAPGSPAWWPEEGPWSSGMRVPAGSRLTIEVHYNTQAIAATTPDLPAWEVWLAEARPRWTLVTVPLVDLDLSIPAGATGWMESATTRLPIDAALVSTGPHMHGLGRGVSTRLTRASGEEVCLTDVTRWDFNWQFAYPTEPEGIAVDVTDTITLTCTYDNPGADAVSWGERTEQEMCLDYLTFAVPSEAGGGEGVCGDFAPCYARCDPDDALCPMTCLLSSGEACLSCGMEAMFGDCTLGACWAPAVDLDSCTRGCSDQESDYARCLSTTCAAEWAAYDACWRASFDVGTCAMDHATCVGMVPEG